MIVYGGAGDGAQQTSRDISSNVAYIERVALYSSSHQTQISAPQGALRINAVD